MEVHPPPRNDLRAEKTDSLLAGSRTNFVHFNVNEDRMWRSVFCQCSCSWVCLSVALIVSFSVSFSFCFLFLLCFFRARITYHALLSDSLDRFMIVYRVTAVTRIYTRIYSGIRKGRKEKHWQQVKQFIEQALSGVPHTPNVLCNFMGCFCFQSLTVCIHSKSQASLLDAAL